MSGSDFFIGVDFGEYSTRCSVLINQEDQLRILDMRDIPLEREYDSLFDRYNAGILDVSEYLKTKKLVVKSMVTNLRGDYIRLVKTSVSETSRKPVNKIKKSLINSSQRKLSKVDARQDDKVVRTYTGNMKVDADKKNGSKKDVSLDSVLVYSKMSDCVELMKASMDNGVHIEEIVPSNLSSSYLFEKFKLEEDEYFIYFDIGHHRTEVSMLNQDIVLSADNYPFGGDDITSMVMEEFNVNFRQAEELKLSWSNELSDVPFGQNKEEIRFAKRLRNELFVLFQMIKKTSLNDGLDPKKLKCMLCSGGASRQFGLVDIAVEYHDKPCYQIGEGPFKYFLNNHIKPEMSCALGLSYISYLKRKAAHEKNGLISSVQGCFNGMIQKLLYSD